MLGRASAWVAVVVVVGTAVVSGPLVGVDLTKGAAYSESPFCEESGNATVDRIEVPTESFRIKPKQFDAGPYYVAAEPARVSVSDIRGCPVLVYRLTIPELGFYSNRLYFLGAGTTEDGTSRAGSVRNVSMSLVVSEFDRERVENLETEALRGILRIELRGDENRTIYRRNISIPVKHEP